MRAPGVRYVRHAGVTTAYQVFGEGDQDLVIVPGFVSHLEMMWENPYWADFLTHLGRFSRLIIYDKRGTGLSDRVDTGSLEDRIGDLTAVLDDAGSRHAVLFGWSEGGAMSLLFAATHPERISGLILYATMPRLLWAEDYPGGLDPELHRVFVEAMEEDWGQGAGLFLYGTSVAEDAEYLDWWGRFQRMAASPGAVRQVFMNNAQVDTRSTLDAITCPVLIVQRSSDVVVDVSHSRYLAQRLPQARYVELPGTDHFYWTQDTEPIRREVEAFVTGIQTPVATEGSFKTLLFTDIVESTARAASLGDQGWKSLLGRHNALIREQADRARGKEVKTTGDGFLFSFDGPARAIHCAREIVNAMPGIGLEVRAGIHAGPCELLWNDLGGLTVHIAARVASVAGAREVLVTEAVRDLIAGSNIQLAAGVPTSLKGVPGTWTLHRVTAP